MEGFVDWGHFHGVSGVAWPTAGDDTRIDRMINPPGFRCVIVRGWWLLDLRCVALARHESQGHVPGGLGVSAPPDA